MKAKHLFAAGTALIVLGLVVYVLRYEFGGYTHSAPYKSGGEALMVLGTLGLAAAFYFRKDEVPKLGKS